MAEKPSKIEQQETESFPLDRILLEVFPEFSKLSDRVQQQVITVYEDALSFIEFVQNNRSQVTGAAQKIKETLMGMDESSGVIIAALMLNACSGCQELRIPASQGAIMLNMLYKIQKS